MNKISQLPIGAQIRFVQDALQKEKQARAKFLSGKNREAKMEEIDACIDAMHAVEQEYRQQRKDHAHSPQQDHIKLHLSALHEALVQERAERVEHLCHHTRTFDPCSIEELDDNLASLQLIKNYILASWGKP